MYKDLIFFLNTVIKIIPSDNLKWFKKKLGISYFIDHIY